MLFAVEKSGTTIVRGTVIFYLYSEISSVVYYRTGNGEAIMPLGSTGCKGL
jgi:hypothetical protein